MSRVFAAILIAAFAFAPYAAHAQDDNAYRAGKPRSQQDIIRERESACRGLKGEALTECLANYVGPKDDKAERGGSYKKPANPPKPQGRT